MKTQYDKKRNPRFERAIHTNDCAEDDDTHQWEPIGSSAQGCVHCVQTRPVRDGGRWW